MFPGAVSHRAVNRVDVEVDPGIQNDFVVEKALLDCDNTTDDIQPTSAKIGIGRDLVGVIGTQQLGGIQSLNLRAGRCWLAGPRSCRNGRRLLLSLNRGGLLLLLKDKGAQNTTEKRADNDERENKAMGRRVHERPR